MSDRQRLCDILLIARSLNSNLSNALQPVQLISDILPAIEAMASNPLKIKTDRKEWPCNQFNSALFRYHDHADILYSHALNLCWRRFAICKEAAHLLVDDSTRNHFTTDVVELIAGLITSAPMMNADSPLESEQMGVVAAIEILLPWKFRQQIKALHPGKSDLEIAEYCKVPEKFVNLVLHSSYGIISDSINSELD